MDADVASQRKAMFVFQQQKQPGTKKLLLLQQTATLLYHCPAKYATCNFCGKIGRFQKICRKQMSTSSKAGVPKPGVGEW